MQLRAVVICHCNLSPISSHSIQMLLSFDANFSSFSLAESPPRDLQITADIMVCSCAMSSNCVWFKCMVANNILLMRKWSHAFLLPVIARTWKWQIASNPWVYLLKNKLGDRMIKHLLNSVIAKYRGFSVSRRSIVCLMPKPSDLLPTDPHSLFDRMERNECSPKKTCALIHCADFPCNVLSYNSLKMLWCKYVTIVVLDSLTTSRE